MPLLSHAEGHFLPVCPHNFVVYESRARRGLPHRDTCLAQLASTGHLRSECQCSAVQGHSIADVIRPAYTGAASCDREKEAGVASLPEGDACRHAKRDCRNGTAFGDNEKQPPACCSQPLGQVA